PYYTFLSTLRFYRKVLPLFALQKWEDEKIKEGFIKNYNDMYSVFEKDRELIPKNNIIDVKYEDLTRNPLEIVEGTYETLEIGEFSKVKNAIKKFVKTQANYKPNIHTISNEIINEVNENWFEKMEKYGYSQLKPNNIK
ncbi:MAG: sulfotransferase, partial [Candidatus Heimdallarchaeota archaeon]|nr:sulfotransferase [Candidatus Heimdallarchaeota archaeon]